MASWKSMRLRGGQPGVRKSAHRLSGTFSASWDSRWMLTGALHALKPRQTCGLALSPGANNSPQFSFCCKRQSCLSASCLPNGNLL